MLRLLNYLQMLSPADQTRSQAYVVCILQALKGDSHTAALRVEGRPTTVSCKTRTFKSKSTSASLGGRRCRDFTYLT